MNTERKTQLTGSEISILTRLELKLAIMDATIEVLVLVVKKPDVSHRCLMDSSAHTSFNIHVLLSIYHAFTLHNDINNLR